MSGNALSRYRNVVSALAGTIVHRRPEDTSEYVFIATACDVIGNALLGDEWTGKEAQTEMPPVIPDCIDNSFRGGLLATFDPIDEAMATAEFHSPPGEVVFAYAEELLRTERPNLIGRNSLNILVAQSMNWTFPRVFTVKEWKIVQELAAHRRISAMESRRRWIQVIRKIKTLGEEGVLETVLRPLEGGVWSHVLDRSLWRFEAYEARFSTGQMNLESPFRFSPDLPGNKWIFFSTRSLDAAVLKLSAKKAVEAQGIRDTFVSDQIQFLLEVVKSLGITAENPQNKLSVEAHIRANWPWDEQPSGGDVKWFATIARNREAKGGKNRQKVVLRKR